MQDEVAMHNKRDKRDITEKLNCPIHSFSKLNIHEWLVEYFCFSSIAN